MPDFIASVRTYLFTDANIHQRTSEGRPGGQAPHASEQIRTAGVRRVRSESGPDSRAARIGAKAIDEPLGVREVGRCRAVEERVAHDRAQPARLHRGRHRVHVAVSVGDGRHAVLEQLQTAGQSTPPEIVRVEPPLQWKQPAVQPLAARHVQIGRAHV